MKEIFSFSPEISLENIIRAMEECGKGCLVVVDSNRVFQGMITERDIRNFILNHNENKDIKDIINKNVPTISHRISQAEAMSLLKGSSLQFLPILNEGGKLIDFIEVLGNHIKKKPNKVVIMAGGLGTRLGELTQSIPKPMLPMGHKPILHIILDSLVDYGFEDFYFCVNYKAEVIREYFGDGKAFGVNISYIEEVESLGTAGALSLIEEDFDHPFILMNGDLITTLNFDSLLNFHLERDSLATMCVHEYNQQLPFGVVHTRNGKILHLEEKPYHTYFVNAGIYILNPELKQQIPFNQHYDITTLFDSLIQNEARPNAYIINEFWVDIGQISEYEKTRKVFTSLGI